MNREKIGKLYKKYELTEEDVFKHKHYLIITRSGIEKVSAKESITVTYEVIRCEKDFCVVKAIATKGEVQLETFGSAIKGATYADGSTNSFYVMEMAEKRSFSRAVLKMTGFYELGVFGEDESEDFKKG